MVGRVLQAAGRDDLAAGMGVAPDHLKEQERLTELIQALEEAGEGGGPAPTGQQQGGEPKLEDEEVSGAGLSASEDEKEARGLNGEKPLATQKAKRAEANLIRERRLKKTAA